MNEWQVFRQIEYLIRQRKWPGGSTPVFAPASVMTTEAPSESALTSMISPVCLLKTSDGQTDPERKAQPDLEQVGVEVLLMTVNPGDIVGHKALLGGNRPTTATFGQQSSKGRGLLEVQTEMKAALKLLGNTSGVRIQYVSESKIGAMLDEKKRYIAWRTYRYSLWCGDELFYHPCRNLVATTPGGGQVSLTWKIPPDRYDRYRVVLRRAAGATPPASITAGTGVTLSGPLATSVTDTPGAGPFAYALFATYDETNTFKAIAPVASQDQRVSDAVTKAVTVV